MISGSSISIGSRSLLLASLREWKPSAIVTECLPG